MCFCLQDASETSNNSPRTIWLDFNVSFIHWAEQNLSHFLGKGGISNAIVRVLLNPAEGQNTTTDLERYADTDGFQLRLYSLCSVDNHDTNFAAMLAMSLALGSSLSGSGLASVSPLLLAEVLRERSSSPVLHMNTLTAISQEQ